MISVSYDFYERKEDYLALPILIISIFFFLIFFVVLGLIFNEWSKIVIYGSDYHLSYARVMFTSLRRTVHSLSYQLLVMLKQFWQSIVLFLIIMNTYRYFRYGEDVMYAYMGTYMLVEIIWFFYLFFSDPFKWYTLNRILYINQLLYMGAVAVLFSQLIQMETDEDNVRAVYLSIIIIAFLMLPVSYLYAGIHALILKCLFKYEHNRIIDRREVKKKRKNLR